MTRDAAAHRIFTAPPDTGLSRRAFVTTGLAACLLAASGGMAVAGPPVRELSLVNLHTGERASVPYWEQGRYHIDALHELDKVLRDHRTGEIFKMHRRLYDTLHALSHHLDGPDAFHVVSGYRSPKSNALLRQASSAVAKKSYHMQGMAIDMRVPGVPLNTLHRAARRLHAGGVGKYVRSNFVHMDVGPVRYW